MATMEILGVPMAIMEMPADGCHRNYADNWKFSHFTLTIFLPGLCCLIAVDEKFYELYCHGNILYYLFGSPNLGHSFKETLHAISKDEYDEKTTEIKKNPEIIQFLTDNKFVLSQYGVFFDKIAEMMSHVRKTKTGNDTINHVLSETETVLKEKRTYGFIKSILEGARQVLTSDVGRANLMAVAHFIQDELQIPKLFEMCLSLKKIILYILLSNKGLDSLVKIKENNWVLETSPDTAPLIAMLNNDFPIMSLPYEASEIETQNNQAKENVSQMRSILSKMESINRQ